MWVGQPVGQVTAQDHLSLANQQVGVVENTLVLFWTGEVFCIQFFQVHEEVAQTGQEELAAVDPVVVALTLTCGGFIEGPACKEKSWGTFLRKI